MPRVLPEVFIPIHSLIPSQPDVARIPTLRYLAEQDLDEIPPVEAVLLNDDPENPVHLLVDGHHRSFNAHHRGRDIIRAFLASQDEHLPFLGAPAVADCASIDDVRRRYEREWRPHTRALGITSAAQIMYFGDPLPVFR
jgi:hypothetical protein